MQKEIHPKRNNVIFRDKQAGSDFYCMSTVGSKDKEVVDGVEYDVINIDVSSASHPFYTGKENIIDSAGRVEKFKNRVSKKVSSGKKTKDVSVKKEVDILEKK